MLRLGQRTRARATLAPCCGRRGSSMGHRTMRLLSTNADMTPEMLIAQLASQQQAAAVREVPWFLENMPKAYFRQVSATTRQRHLRAIVALSSERITVPEIRLRDDGDVTFMNSFSSQTSSISRQLATLPKAAIIQKVHLFSSLDERLSVHVFSTAKEHEQRCSGNSPEERAAMDRHQAYLSALLKGSFTGDEAGKHAPPSSDLTPASLDAYLRRCPSSYVISHVPRLLVKQRHLCERVAGTDDVYAARPAAAARAPASLANESHP